MARMKELYENIWWAYVDQGMTVEQIAHLFNCPLDWVTGALELAEQDENYESGSCNTIQ